jgi:hypothetical protein
VRCFHKYVAWFFVVTLDEKTQRYMLVKIGQRPSLEDIVGGDLVKYKTILDSEDFRELERATGLASQGIGIGSFVYLRRIFERLVEKHRQELEVAGNPIADWEGMRMVERVAALSSVLPPAVVKHKAAYGILSNGIHELSEEECRKHFPALRTALMLILEQDRIAQEQKSHEKQLEADMAEIQNELAEKSGH